MMTCWWILFQEAVQLKHDLTEAYLNAGTLVQQNGSYDIVGFFKGYLCVGAQDDHTITIYILSSVLSIGFIHV